MRPGAIALFGAGQLGVNLLARYFFQWVIRFADLGKDTASGAMFSAGMVGLVFFGFRIFDGITDPMAGVLGDRWVGAGRQRRSLIWLSFLIPALGLAMVFAPDPSMAAGLRWTLLCAGMFCFFVGYTLYCIPYWSLVEDYSQGDLHTRSILSNTLGVGVLLATGTGFVLSPLLVEALGFFHSALLFCVVGTVLMTLPYFAAPAGAKPRPVEHLPPMRETLRSSLTHRRFLAVILLFSGAQMSLTVMTAAAPYIAERVLHGTLADVSKLLGPFLVASMPAFFFVPKMTRRYGWERSTLAGVIVLSLAYVGVGMLGKGIIGSPMTTAMVVFACAGPGCALVLGIEGEAIARCAQASRYKSTGIYFGIYNFIIKALNGLALFFAGTLAEQGSLWAIRAMPIIAGLLCGSGVIVYLSMRKTDPEPHEDSVVASSREISLG